MLFVQLAMPYAWCLRMVAVPVQLWRRTCSVQFSQGCCTYSHVRLRSPSGAAVRDQEPSGYTASAQCAAGSPWVQQASWWVLLQLMVSTGVWWLA
jgi:hypothetical protein